MVRSFYFEVTLTQRDGGLLRDVDHNLLQALDVAHSVQHGDEEVQTLEGKTGGEGNAHGEMGSKVTVCRDLQRHDK